MHFYQVCFSISCLKNIQRIRNITTLYLSENNSNKRKIYIKNSVITKRNNEPYKCFNATFLMNNLLVFTK